MERFADVEPRVWSDPRLKTPTVNRSRTGTPSTSAATSTATATRRATPSAAAQAAVAPTQMYPSAPANAPATVPDPQQQQQQLDQQPASVQEVSHGYGTLGSQIELERRLAELQRQQQLLYQELMRQKMAQQQQDQAFYSQTPVSQRSQPTPQAVAPGVSNFNQPTSVPPLALPSAQFEGPRSASSSVTPGVPQPYYPAQQQSGQFAPNPTAPAADDSSEESIYNLTAANPDSSRVATNSLSASKDYTQPVIRGGSVTKRPNGTERPASASRKPSLPSQEELRAAAEALEQANQSVAGKNHLVQNTLAVISGASARRTPRQQTAPNIPPPTPLGQVPKYLVERKAQWAEEERKRKEAEERAKEPPGMIRLPEEQRLETLALLRQRHATLLQQAAAAPLVIETESRKRQQRELEDQIRHVEGMIKAMEHEVVYVKP